MAMLEIKMHKKGALKAIQAIADGMPNTMVRALMRAAQHTEAVVKSEVVDSVKDSRTGQLARSFHPVFLGRDGNALKAAVRSKLVYAGIQNDGGTIYPTTVKYLAVPLRRLPVGKWPRHFGKGELVRLGKPGGNQILAKITKRGQVTPMFALKTSVTLRAKHYLEAAGVRAEPGIAEIFGQQVDETIARNGGA